MPDDAGEGQPEGVRASGDAVGDRQLDGQQRPLVLADAELRERELVVPAQQLAIRLAEHVADRRREVGPADERERRIEDDGHAEVEAAAAVEHEIPAGDPIALGPLDRLETQVGEPALDVGRAHGGRAGVGGRHGPRSLADWLGHAGHSRRDCPRARSPAARRAPPTCRRRATVVVGASATGLALDRARRS